MDQSQECVSASRTVSDAELTVNERTGEHRRQINPDCDSAISSDLPPPPLLRLKTGSLYRQLKNGVTFVAVVFSLFIVGGVPHAQTPGFVGQIKTQNNVCMDGYFAKRRWPYVFHRNWPFISLSCWPSLSYAYLSNQTFQYYPDSNKLVFNSQCLSTKNKPWVVLSSCSTPLTPDLQWVFTPQGQMTSNGLCLQNFKGLLLGVVPCKNSAAQQWFPSTCPLSGPTVAQNIDIPGSPTTLALTNNAMNDQDFFFLQASYKGNNTALLAIQAGSYAVSTPIPASTNSINFAYSAPRELLYAVDAVANQIVTLDATQKFSIVNRTNLPVQNMGQGLSQLRLDETNGLLYTAYENFAYNFELANLNATARKQYLPSGTNYETVTDLMVDPDSGMLYVSLTDNYSKYAVHRSALIVKDPSDGYSNVTKMQFKRKTVSFDYTSNPGADLFYLLPKKSGEGLEIWAFDSATGQVKYSQPQPEIFTSEPLLLNETTETVFLFKSDNQVWYYGEKLSTPTQLNLPVITSKIVVNPNTNNLFLLSTNDSTITVLSPNKFSVLPKLQYKVPFKPTGMAMHLQKSRALVTDGVDRVQVVSWCGN